MVADTWLTKLGNALGRHGQVFDICQLALLIDQLSLPSIFVPLFPYFVRKRCATQVPANASQRQSRL